jgi:hypothetical protein
VVLPNSERAIVDEAKVRDYLLSPSHPVGRFKAAFFSGRQAALVTVWMVPNGRDFAHFVTAFPG